MRIKNLLFALLALPLLFVACDKDNPVVDELKEPTVAVTAGLTAEHAITFTVTSTDAEKVAYLVVEGVEAPTASEVLANGTAIEVNKSVELKAADLEAATEYTIVAAAQNAKAVVKASATMTTKEAETPGPGPKPEAEKFVATHIFTGYENVDGLLVYYFEVGDKGWGSNGWGVDGGTYYSFAIIASAKGNGILPKGTYVLSEYTNANTIIPEYAYRYQMVDGDVANGLDTYKDAILEITDGKIEANVELQDGTLYNVVFEGDLAVEDGGSQRPEEFTATHVADKWYWGGSSNYGYKYMVAGENFSVDVHFQPQNASETAITAGTYTWTTTTMWGYNDFEEFTTRTFTVDGTSVAVDAGDAVVTNEGDVYHIEMTLMGRDGFVYMIEYNGKLNDKGDVGGDDNTLVINTLGAGSYNASYYFYTFKAAGDNFSFDLVISDYHAKEEIINAGTYQCASSVSYAGNKNMFYANNFKYDGVSYKPTEASTMVVEGDGTNVSIRMNLVMQSGDAFVVTYNGKVGGSANEGGSTELTKLATPSVSGLVSGNAATVSWNEIAGAKDYTVTLNGTDVQTVSTAYIVYENLAWETTYSVSVVANPADAAVNAASDAGTATFTTEANSGSGDEGGNDDVTTSDVTLKFVKDLSSEYGAGYELYCYYELTSGADVIGFWIYNNKSDKHYLYDGTYTNGTSLNHIAYNPSSGVFIENVTIDGQYVSRTNNAGAQTSSTIEVSDQGGHVVINLDYVDEYAVAHSRTYTFSGTITK